MKTIAILSLLVLSLSCDDEQDLYSPGANRDRCDPQDRKGCLCNDGTILTSTEVSACDNNGGLKEWICQKGS